VLVDKGALGADRRHEALAVESIGADGCGRRGEPEQREQRETMRGCHRRQ
jgi:hypothetical protein